MRQGKEMDILQNAMRDLATKKKRTCIAHVGKNEHNYIHLAAQTQQPTGRFYRVKRQKGI